ncbi:hypothetical protein [Sphingobium lignivorans]|uniref:Uncharacterized protein n=1 Tax=Sphingobium lignivorans TaxID=2735886 RepID=A0ABR6NHA6_9SPHN|nr:hypothetical protein [Sphingobium lignivorans]MBB5986659.1 hypothetical protein [Sphingobium lignivorans]
MKLIQYRFNLNALSNASLIGHAVQAFFERERDLALRAVYVDKGEPDKLAVKAIDIEQVGGIIERSFIQSCADVVCYSEYASIRSNTSCRFVIIEDDGLLRVCHAQDDAMIDFADMPHTSEDISEMLVKSDLFD